MRLGKKGSFINMRVTKTKLTKLNTMLTSMQNWMALKDKKGTKRNQIWESFSPLSASLIATLAFNIHQEKVAPQPTIKPAVEPTAKLAKEESFDHISEDS